MTYVICNLNSNFESIQEMDATVREYNKELKKNQYRVLDILRRYSCKTIGVSHLKQDTIADKLNLSRRTICTIIKRLKELGMITVVHTHRPKHKNNGACKYIINTKEQRETILRTTKASQQNDDENTPKSPKNKPSEESYVKKETFSLLKQLNKSLCKPSVEKTPSQLRFENMKKHDIRVKPMNCSEELYLKLKPFFTDAQIQRHIDNIDVKLVGKYLFTFNDNEKESIIEYALMTLVKKIKKGFNLGKRMILNEFAFAKGVALNYAEKVVEYGYQL